jgi:hypothetical protein
MSVVSCTFRSAFFWALIVGPVFAQTPALDVKMGLWEVTSVTDIGGQLPAVDTSKLPPEQRAKIEEAMKAMMGAHSRVTKSCMTKEKFDKTNFMMTDQPGMACKQTIVANTRSTLDTSVVCTGDRAMTGQIHIDALSSTSIKGNMKSSTSGQGNTITFNMVMTGKWLGADCGDTK